MRGLLADVNVQGEVPYLLRLLIGMDLYWMLEALNLSFATFDDIGISQDLDDRSIWNLCQAEGWLLLTDNRNREGADSLGMTLADSWRDGQLPVVTISRKRRFAQEPEYAELVAKEIAEILFGVAQGEYRDQPRIFVPR
jgi:hypothetical protein